MKKTMKKTMKKETCQVCAMVLQRYQTSDIRDNVKKELEKMFHLGNVIEMKKEMN